MSFGDELRSLENGDVLLYGGEAHRETPSQVRHGVLALQDESEYVASCRIGESVEQPVRPLVYVRVPATYNHMVVD